MESKDRHVVSNRKSDYRCSVEATLDLIDGRWKILILFRLTENEPLRFSELRNSILGITEKMLTTRLRELESDGLISRKVYPVVPPKTEYRLTPLGKSLEPLLLQMRSWGDTYRDNR